MFTLEEDNSIEPIRYDDTGMKQVQEFVDLWSKALMASMIMPEFNLNSTYTITADDINDPDVISFEVDLSDHKATCVSFDMETPSYGIHDFSITCDDPSVILLKFTDILSDDMHNGSF